jgi:hypothetical protein
MPSLRYCCYAECRAPFQGHVYKVCVIYCKLMLANVHVFFTQHIASRARAFVSSN